MRILWFSLSAPFHSNGDFHNGGGWMLSLASHLSLISNVELGIAYEGNEKENKVVGGIQLYPIDCFSKKINKLKRYFNPRIEEQLLLHVAKKVIEDFQPDIIHIWGTESAFGLIAKEISVPCILHVQGILTPYYNAQFPPGFNRIDLYRYFRLQPCKLLRILLLDRTRRYRSEREERILNTCQNYLGRTEWDKAIVSLINPKAKYFYCSEILRDSFWNARGKWRRAEQTTRRIISVLSMPTYKGHDLILKTAHLLKKHYKKDFIWEVYGVWSMEMWEMVLGISCRDVCIRICGTVDAENLKEALLHADIFVHPSYADNSPNSLCEAQLLGLPVIATYVGGVPSLVSDGKTGMLIPANDPFMLAEHIRQVIEDPRIAINFGQEAATVAENRHNPDLILKDLLSAYMTIQHCK